MRNNSTKFGFALAALAAACMLAGTGQAQCTTCAVPQVAYSPVVYNTYYEGWYLGKYLGRMGRRVFGTAPAPAYQASYATAYAPTYSYASYAPSCNTCGTSPCCCPQTVCRPVIMQPVSSCCTTCYAPSCSTCATCDSCSTCGVTQAAYGAPVSSGCPTCDTSSYVQSSADSAAPSLPSNGSAAPPQTFRETDRVTPVPAEESADGQNVDLSAPMLLDPNDQMTKRPTAPVWTAVYKEPAKITSISAPKTKKTIGWTSGR